MSYGKKHMNADDDLYRAILSYEHQETKWLHDPVTKRNTYVRTGPVEVKEFTIGPYFNTSNIKSYITRHRNRKTNLKLVRVERSATWEEVEL